MRNLLLIALFTIGLVAYADCMCVYGFERGISTAFHPHFLVASND
jgi:hypothetical protein